MEKKIKFTKKKVYVLSIFTTIVLLLFTNVFTVSAHYDTAYWHEISAAGNRQEWMKNIKGETKLSELSIPGTHDSMAFKDNLFAIDSTRTQTMDLTKQLNSGIRFLDIRAKYTETGFPLHHGTVYLGYDFEDVLKTCEEFLTQHPSETILIRFKQEHSSASDAQMRKVFDTYYKRYQNLFWKPQGQTNPTLDQCRGKIVLVSDVISLNDLGINHRKLNVQDNYNLGTNWDLYQKWESIKAHAQKISITDNVISINYLNAFGGVMPYFAASGHSSPQTGAPRLLTGLTEPAFSSWYPEFPREGKVGNLSSIAFEGMNTMYANLLEKGTVSHTGIVVADFPGERLISNIIEMNDPLTENIYTGRYRLISSSFSTHTVDQNLDNLNKVTMWTKNGGINQQWDLKYDKQKKAYQIVSAYDGKVLTLDSSNGNTVVLKANNKQPEQYWIIKEQGFQGVTLKNYKNNQYLGFQEYSPKNGSKLIAGPMTLSGSFFSLVK